MTRKVYLAGPVAGYADDVVYDWRHQAHELFSVHSSILVPVDPPALNAYTMGGLDARAIVTADLAALRECDAVLANVNHPSFGVGMEILTAYMTGRLVFSFCSPGTKLSAFVKHHSQYLEDCLERAVARLVEIYSHV